MSSIAAESHEADPLEPDPLEQDPRAADLPSTGLAAGQPPAAEPPTTKRAIVQVGDTVDPHMPWKALPSEPEGYVRQEWTTLEPDDVDE